MVSVTSVFRWTMFCREKSSCGASKPQPTPYAMQQQTIMEEQESRRELYDDLKRLTQREQTYLLYR